jgi:PPM family protein phosphatase
MITEFLVTLAAAVLLVLAVFVLRIPAVRAVLRRFARHLPVLGRFVRSDPATDRTDQLLDELQRIPTRLSAGRAVNEFSGRDRDEEPARRRTGGPAQLESAERAALEPAPPLPKRSAVPAGVPEFAAAEKRRGGLSSWREDRDGGLRWAVAGHTNQGLRRERNEDEYVVTAELVAIADGIGGGPAGDLAARIVVETVHHVLTRAEDPVRELAVAVERAASALFGAAMVESGLRGMGSTLDVVVLGSGRSPMAHGAHVGDGAVWLIPASGRAVALTEPQLDAHGNLTGAVSSTVEPRVETWRRTIREGDRLVLTSDGFHAHLQNDEHATRLLEEFRDDPPNEAARALVSAALGAGGRDNVTVVVADYGDPELV